MKKKHYWNYRVVTKVIDKQRIFTIAEIYYDDDKIVSWPVDLLKNGYLCWESFDELKGTYELMKSAFEKPVVDLDEIEKNIVK